MLYNERKFIILRTIIKLRKFVNSKYIAEACDMSEHNASEQLKKLYQQGYINRRNVKKKCFLYQFLKPKGERVLKRLWIRNRLKEITDDGTIDFNLEHDIPDEYKDIELNAQLEQDYNKWLHGD